jgi:hypothetical protein
VPKGKHKVKVEASKPAIDLSFEVEIKDRDVNRRIGIGFVEADGELMLQQGRRSARKIALLEGRQQVTIVDPRTGEQSKKTVVVQAGGTVKVGEK